MRPLLKHQAAVMRELCAQTALMREIRDALQAKNSIVISEAFGVREPAANPFPQAEPDRKGVRSSWSMGVPTDEGSATPQKISCWQRLRNGGWPRCYVCRVLTFIALFAIAYGVVSLLVRFV